MKVVAATVVLVIACKKEMLAKANKQAAKTPCIPIPLSLSGTLFPHRKNNTVITANPNVIDR